MMDFKVGDKVKIIDEKGEGEITRLQGDFAWVKIDDFEYKYLRNKLVAAGNVPDFDENGSPQIKDLKTMDEYPTNEQRNGLGYKLRKGKKHKKHNNQVREVDLHIYELVDEYKGLSHTEIMNIQIAQFIRHLESAIINKEKKIIFIHGVGEGVLKQEVRRILKTYNNISFYDAPYRKYGYGATEVIIH